MAKSGVLRIKIVGDDGPLSKTLSNAGGKVGSFAKSVAKFGAVAGAAAAAGGAAVLNMGAKLEDMDKKAAAVFEDQLPKVQKWAQANAGAMGLTATQLTGLTANFADLLKPMGFTAEQAAEMAQETNELSGALAKWSGGQKTAAEVSDILAKAMLGEREGLKQLGISITEADVQARLAANGTEELTGAALEQAKAIATQELIMEKSTDAQEAWADGQDDLSVKINKARAKVEEFKEKAVRTLLPLVISAAEKMAEWGQAIGRNLQPHIEALSAWWSQNGPAIISTMQDMWSTASTVFGNIQRIIGQVVGFVQQVMGRFRGEMGSSESKVSGWFQSVSAIFLQVREVFASAFAAITTIVQTAINIITEFWNRFGTHIVDFLVRTVGRLIDIMSGLFEFLKGIFDLIKAVLTGQWGDAWDAIKNILSGAWKVIHTLIAAAWDTVKTIFGAGVAAISQVWSFLWDQARDKVRSVWDWITGKISAAIDFVKGIFLNFTGPGLLLKHWDTIREGIAGVTGFFRDAWNRTISFFTSIPSRIASAARGMWDSIANGFRSMINRVIGWWNSLSFTVPPIDMPGPYNFGGATVGTPNIPMLAQGGIVTKPTLAMIGEAGPEAVIPLSKRNGNGAGESHVHFHIGTMIGDKTAIRRMLQEALRDYERSNGRTALTA